MTLEGSGCPHGRGVNRRKLIGRFWATHNSERCNLLTHYKLIFYLQYSIRVLFASTNPRTVINVLQAVDMCNKMFYEIDLKPISLIYYIL